MKTKLAVGLVLVLIVTLSFGCYPSDGAITGGGFLEECEGKVSFGFNVKGTQVEGSDYDVKGQFQLVDHSAKLRVHGTFDEVVYMLLVGWVASGECTVNGDGPHKFYLYAYDAGEPAIYDYIFVYLEISGPDLVYQGIIDGGNIQVRGDLANSM
jgi:hypothetical protein